MEILTYDCLPVVLVSAKERTSASSIISEIIDEESTEHYKTDGIVVEDRVWRIDNKYYSADVRLRARGDGEPEGELVEAQLIVLGEGEGEAEAGGRRREVGGPQLLMARGGGEGLAAWAAQSRVELVDDEGGDGDEGEEGGVARVRAALQAHEWRGMVRRQRPASPSEGSLEAFLAALAALPAAAAMRHAPEAPERRLSRAEALVAAFCRALGDLDA